MASHICPWWLAYTFDNPLRKLVHNPAKLFGDYIQPGMTAADIGCGMGFFSLGMAPLVCPGGKVIAIDLQTQMLRIVRQRATKSGLEDVIHTHQTSAHTLSIPEPLDFALTFWMVHETPDPVAFFRQIRSGLKPHAKVLMAEPKMHVNEAQFASEVAQAEQAGFIRYASPAVAFSHAALLCPTP